MSAEALSVVTNAEYLAIFKSGHNCHKVDSLLTQIYLLCSVNQVEKARPLLERLYRLIYQREELERLV